uniref:Uncharacterized protein n=1 Tax=Caenorhabditis japonica TaxID=281687 RepID=A0A8R1EM14_CAEJA
MINIVLPQMNYKIYAETSIMDFNKFLSQLGGQLGVLMGINIVTFVEVAFFLVGIIMLARKRQFEVAEEDHRNTATEHFEQKSMGADDKTST